MSTTNLILQSCFAIVCSIVVLAYMDMLPLVIRKVNVLVHGKAGCVPVSNIGNVTLHYFAGRGRGEGIRLMLEYAEIPYTETKFTKDTWPAHKRVGTESKLYTFGQVPAIETTSGLRLAQSQAILHYIGRSAGMDCDCDDLHLCEVVALGVEDAMAKLTRMVYDPNFKMADREKYLTETMPLWLSYFENLAPALTKQEMAYFVGDRMTWVDFLVFELIENNKEFSRYDFGQDKNTNVDVLEMFPKLSNFYSHFKGHPKIARYLQSKRRPAYKVPALPVDSPLTKNS